MENSSKKPFLIEGGFAIDDRGQLTFANQFDFKEVKRFYMVENFSTDLIRAWHGHEKEKKYIFVPVGSAIVAAVRMTNTQEPDKTQQVDRFILSSRKPSILFIPGGYANGFRVLESNTKIMFFSSSTLEESSGDDFRFPHNYWGNKVWEIEHR